MPRVTVYASMRYVDEKRSSENQSEKNHHEIWAPIKRKKELKYRKKKDIHPKEKLSREGEVIEIIYMIKISLNKLLKEKINVF